MSSLPYQNIPGYVAEPPRRLRDEISLSPTLILQDHALLAGLVSPRAPIAVWLLVHDQANRRADDEEVLSTGLSAADSSSTGGRQR